jgi:excisionase family DNA binding protein
VRVEPPEGKTGGTTGARKAVDMPQNAAAGRREDGDLSRVQFLTVAEVAATMRVSKMTVYRLVHNGELPAVRVGRSFRVPEEAVHEYLRGSYIDVG